VRLINVYLLSGLNHRIYSRQELGNYISNISIVINGMKNYLYAINSIKNAVGGFRK